MEFESTISSFGYHLIRVNWLEAAAYAAPIVSDGQEPLSDILWDGIVSIEPAGDEHVYDIEVEGTHNFIGNGIFAHNTYLLAPVRSAALPAPNSARAEALEIQEAENREGKKIRRLSQSESLDRRGRFVKAGFSDSRPESQSQKSGRPWQYPRQSLPGFSRILSLFPAGTEYTKHPLPDRILFSSFAFLYPIGRDQNNLFALLLEDNLQKLITELSLRQMPIFVSSVGAMGGGYSLFNHGGGQSPLTDSFPNMFRVMKRHGKGNNRLSGFPVKEFVTSRAEARGKDEVAASRLQSAGKTFIPPFPSRSETRMSAEEMFRIGVETKERLTGKLNSEIVKNEPIFEQIPPKDRERLVKVLTRGDDFLTRLQDSSLNDAEKTTGIFSAAYKLTFRLLRFINSMLAKYFNKPIASGELDHTRTTIFRLSKPVEINGRIFKAIKIKGGRIPISKEITSFVQTGDRQPSVSFTMEARPLGNRSVAIPLIQQKLPEPYQTMHGEDAQREFYATKAAWDRELLVNAPMAYGLSERIFSFQDRNGELVKEPVGYYVSLLTNNHDERFFETVRKRVKSDFKKWQKGSFSQNEAQELKEWMHEIFRDYGNALRNFNEFYAHGWPHSGNVNLEGKGFNFQDNDSMILLDAVSRGERLGYLMNDLLQFLQAIHEFERTRLPDGVEVKLYGKDQARIVQFLKSIGINVQKAALGGYFQHTSDDPRIDQIKESKTLDDLFLATRKPIDETHPIAQLFLDEFPSLRSEIRSSGVPPSTFDLPPFPSRSETRMEAELADVFREALKPVFAGAGVSMNDLRITIAPSERLNHGELFRIDAAPEGGYQIEAGTAAVRHRDVLGLWIEILKFGGIGEFNDAGLGTVVSKLRERLAVNGGALSERDIEKFLDALFDIYGGEDDFAAHFFTEDKRREALQEALRPYDSGLVGQALKKLKENPADLKQWHDLETKLARENAKLTDGGLQSLLNLYRLLPFESTARGATVSLTPQDFALVPFESDARKISARPKILFSIEKSARRILERSLAPSERAETLGRWIRSALETQSPASRIEPVLKSSDAEEALRSIPGITGLLLDQNRAKPLFETLSVIRSLVPETKSGDNDFSVEIADRLYARVDSGSYRRHILYETAPDGSARGAVEIKMPGELKHKRETDSEDFSVSEAFRNIESLRGKYQRTLTVLDYAPGIYSLYGQQVHYEKGGLPFRVIVSEYDMNAHWRRMRLNNFAAANRGAIDLETAESITRQVGEIVFDGIAANGWNGGQDLVHLQNFYVTKNAGGGYTIGLVNDFGDYRRAEGKDAGWTYANLLKALGALHRNLDASSILSPIYDRFLRSEARTSSALEAEQKFEAAKTVVEALRPRNLIDHSAQSLGRSELREIYELSIADLDGLIDAIAETWISHTKERAEVLEEHLGVAQAAMDESKRLLEHLRAIDKLAPRANGTITIGIRLATSGGHDSFLAQLVKALEESAQNTEVLAEPSAARILQTKKTPRVSIRPVTSADWRRGVQALRSEQADVPVVVASESANDPMEEMFNGIYLDWGSTKPHRLVEDFGELLLAVSLVELAAISSDPQHKAELVRRMVDPKAKAEYLKTQLLLRLADLGYPQAMFAAGENGFLALDGGAALAYLEMKSKEALAQAA